MEYFSCDRKTVDDSDLANDDLIDSISINYFNCTSRFSNTKFNQISAYLIGGVGPVSKTM